MMKENDKSTKLTKVEKLQEVLADIEVKAMMNQTRINNVSY